MDESALDAKYGSRVSDESVSKGQRRDLIKGVKRGDDASERLDAAVSMASRTDEVGDAILQNLQEQREKIMSARVSAETMEEDMNISERRMTRMACEKCIQKWVLWVILAAVLAGLVVFAYYKLEIEPSRRTPGAAAAAAMGKRGARRLLMMVHEELKNSSDLQISMYCSAYRTLHEHALPPERLYDSAKTRHLAKLLPQLLGDGHRILMFSQWTSVLDYLGMLLEAANRGRDDTGLGNVRVESFVRLGQHLESVRAALLRLNIASSDAEIAQRPSELGH